MALELTPSRVGVVTVLEVKGRMVAGPNAESFVAKVQELVQNGETRLILDLAKVSYLDSTGISALSCHEDRAHAVCRFWRCSNARKAPCVDTGRGL